MSYLDVVLAVCILVLLMKTKTNDIPGGYSIKNRPLL